ncbi:MAG: hypothetical protein R3354_06855, partial [Thiohalomonadales bacterium]|nr:hypothetical protein [Thiohalomonadales bacterium]
MPLAITFRHILGPVSWNHLRDDQLNPKHDAFEPGSATDIHRIKLGICREGEGPYYGLCTF